VCIHVLHVCSCQTVVYCCLCLSVLTGQLGMCWLCTVCVLNRRAASECRQWAGKPFEQLCAVGVVRLRRDARSKAGLWFQHNGAEVSHLDGSLFIPTIFSGADLSRRQGERDSLCQAPFSVWSGFTSAIPTSTTQVPPFLPDEVPAELWTRHSSGNIRLPPRVPQTCLIECACHFSGASPDGRLECETAVSYPEQSAAKLSLCRSSGKMCTGCVLVLYSSNTVLAG
jgi:hypothetical protein